MRYLTTEEVLLIHERVLARLEEIAEWLRARSKALEP
jgi:hypothetical protein